MKGFILRVDVSFRPSPLLSLCPQESQVFALLVSQSAATRPQWLATSRRSRPSTRPLPTAASGSCPGSSPPTYGGSIPTQMPGGLTLSILFVVSSSFSPHFLPAFKHFPCQNSLFPQNFFSTFCHQQKECTVSSLAGIGCQNPQKKDRPAFAKCSSVLCSRMPRKSAD